MKDWWIKEGWPWLKANWWVLLILPLAALVALGMLVMRVLGTRTVVIDPTEEADERARVEEYTRSRQLEVERDRLAAELEDLRAEHASLREHFEQRLADEVQELRDDPERLRQAMLDAGKPGRAQ